MGEPVFLESVWRFSRQYYSGKTVQVVLTVEYPDDEVQMRHSLLSIGLIHGYLYVVDEVECTDWHDGDFTGSTSCSSVSSNALMLSIC